MTSSQGVVRARAVGRLPESIVASIIDQFGGDTSRSVVFFADPGLAFEQIARAMDDAFEGVTLGCTSSGELFGDAGLCEGSVVAAGFGTDAFDVRAALIDDAKGFNAGRAASVTAPLIASTTSGIETFALLLIDGLSVAEEQVAASLAQSLRSIPLVGGSAGDGLAFQRTLVACNGVSAQNAAVLAVVHTDRPFRTLHSHHFEASNERLVITGADAPNRRVTEVNGLPAAEGYALAVGLDLDTLNPHVFASHPVLLSIGGQYYVRSIQKVNDDGSMTFYCAIDEGLVLRVAQSNDLVETLSIQIDELSADLGEVECLIAFDCILRRLEAIDRGNRDGVRDAFARVPSVGFSTYGEQFNGLHLNQTVTGIAIGRAA